MFFDASYKRSFGGAILFYLMQVVGMYTVVLALSKVLSIYMQSEIVGNIRIIFIMIVVAYIVFAHLSILRERKYLTNKFYLLSTFISAIVTIALGGLVGLLPTIYYVMQSPNVKRES